MKAQATKSRAKQPPVRKPVQTAPLTRMVVTDALLSWVIPAAAAVAALAAFVMYNISMVDEAMAVSVVGLLASFVVVFAGLRGFVEQRITPVLAVALLAFVVLWLGAIVFPFYRAVNPGTPLFAKEISPNAPVTVPMRGNPGHYSVLVQGRFTPVEGHVNRTAAYHLTLGHNGATDRVLAGAFQQEWRTERVGSGRRSTPVPTLHEMTKVRTVIDDPDGHDLTLTLSDLSAVAGKSVKVEVFAELMPQWLLIVLGGAVLAAAVLIDGLRRKGAHEGLLATLTASTLAALAVFCTSSAATPGFPQLIVAALVGTLVGAVAGSLLTRITRPLHKYLPAVE